MKSKKEYAYVGKNIKDIDSKNSFRELVLVSLAPAIEISFKELLELIETNFDLPEKVKSEIISNGICKKIAKMFEANPSLGTYIKVKVGKSDNDVDLLFTNITTNEEYKLEVKVAKNATWRGGEFSMRESDHLLVSWNQEGNDVRIYSCVLFLKKDDWHSNMQNGYYAPSLHKRDLIREDRLDLIGQFVGWYKTDKKTYVKLDEKVLTLNLPATNS